MEYINILLTSALICGILVIVSHWFTIRIVDGNSMEPSLKNGDIVIIKKKYSLELGKIYAFISPEHGDLCAKRLSRIISSPLKGTFSLYFLGDNPSNSCDSRAYGTISPLNVVGEVIKISWRN